MFSNCAYVTTTAGTAQTLKLQTKASAGQITLGGNSGSAVEWTLVDVTQPTPNSFASQSVFGGRQEVTKIGIADLNCDGSSTEVSDPDGMVASIGNISSGACVVTLTTGYFSATPICVVTEETTGTTLRTLRLDLTSATSINIRGREGSTSSSATTVQDSTSFNPVLLCVGKN